MFAAWEILFCFVRIPYPFPTQHIPNLKLLFQKNLNWKLCRGHKGEGRLLSKLFGFLSLASCCKTATITSWQSVLGFSWLKVSGATRIQIQVKSQIPKPKCLSHSPQAEMLVFRVVISCENILTVLASSTYNLSSEPCLCVHSADPQGSYITSSQKD